MAEPKCPNCGTEGADHIVSKENSEQVQSGSIRFHIVYCDQCGNVYDILADSLGQKVANGKARRKAKKPRS